MSNKHLRLSPHRGKDRDTLADFWWYEMPRGVEIHADKNGCVMIRWEQIRAMLKRKDAAAQPAPAKGEVET